MSDAESRTGKKLEVMYQSEAELAEAVKNNPADFVSFLHLEWALGKGVTGKPEELDNSDWPDWKPRKAIDALFDVFGK